jgi:hypothetical protein
LTRPFIAWITECTAIAEEREVEAAPRVERDLDVVGPEAARHLRREAPLVVLRVLVHEAVGLRVRRDAAHVGDDARRVHASREERAHGDVGVQVDADGVGEGRVECVLERAALVAGVGCALQHVGCAPVGARPGSTFGEGQHVTRLEGEHALEHRERSRHVVEAQVTGQGVRVDPAGHDRAREQRVELRREGEALGTVRPVQRLLAEAVAPEVDLAGARVEDREGEHAPELVHAVDSLLLVQVQDDLGVAGRDEAVPARRQLLAQTVVAVELAVADEGDVPLFVQHGLVALRREIHDRESAVPEEEVPEAERAPAVGTSAGEPPQHHLEHALAVHARVGEVEARDPAHQRSASS